MQRVAKQAGLAAAGDRQEQRLHLPERLGPLGRQRQVVLVKAAIGLLPSPAALGPQLLAKVFTH